MKLNQGILRSGMTSYVHLRASRESFDHVVTKHLSLESTYDDLRFNPHDGEKVFACVAERVFFMCKTDSGEYNELGLDDIVVKPDGTCNALTSGTSNPYLHFERLIKLYSHIVGEQQYAYPVRINVNGDLMFVTEVEYWCVNNERPNESKALHIVYFLDRVNADLETDDKDATMSDVNDQDKPETHNQRLPVESLHEYRGVHLLERIGATTTQDLEDELQQTFNLCESDDVMCKFYDYDGWPLHCVRRYADFDVVGDITEYTFVMERCHVNRPPQWFDMENLKEEITRCCERSQDEDVEFRFQVSNREQRMNKLHISYMYYEDENPEYSQDDKDENHRLMVKNVLKFVLTE